MKKLYMSLLLLFAAASTSFSTTHIITNVGFTFSPSSLTVNAGDTIKFVLEAIHTAREVSEATWNANGTTSNGGFDLPSGGGTVVLTKVGIHYYVCVPHASLGMKGKITVNSATGINIAGDIIQNNFILKQNYPNPFNPSTRINYTIPKTSFVNLKIYNVLGKEVATLVNEIKPAGNYEVLFNGSNLASGVYFYKMEADKFSSTKKFILLK